MAREHFRRSGTMSPSPPPTPLSVQLVSSQPLSFSISRILGLDDEPRPDSPRTAHALSPRTCSIRSPSMHRSSPYSDDRSSGSDEGCESEGDQGKTFHEQPPSKKRQRTTFSPIEVWELERVFERRPFLMPEDEEELVRRLGITAKSVKYWFQNRRAKLRKDALKMVAVYQTSPPIKSNQFRRPVSRVRHLIPKESSVVSNSNSRYTDRTRQVESCATWELDRFQHPRAHPSSIKSNQFNGHPSFLLPMFHPDQLKTRPAEPAKLQFSRSFRRYQPY